MQLPNGTNVYRTCPPKSKVSEILHLYHDSDHPGINSTVTNVRREYCWLGMVDEIKQFVSDDSFLISLSISNLYCEYIINLFQIKSCQVCQMTAPIPSKPQRMLQPITPPEQPWQHIGIDLVCNLPLSNSGYLHVLVTV